jgi:hypothetical protein
MSFSYFSSQRAGNPKRNDQMARSVQSWDGWLVSLYSSKEAKDWIPKVRTGILVTGNTSQYQLSFILLKLLTLLEDNYFLTVTNLGSMKNWWWLLKGKHLSLLQRENKSERKCAHNFLPCSMNMRDDKNIQLLISCVVVPRYRKG